MRKQNIIRIVVIAAVIAFAVWKFATIPPVISEIPGEHAAVVFSVITKPFSSVFSGDLILIDLQILSHPGIPGINPT